jgi:signal transduction histidine kinase
VQSAGSDVLLAAGLGVLDLVLSWDRSEPPDMVSPAAVPLLAAIAYAPLAWRRRRPVPVLVLTVAASLVVAAVVPRFVPLLSCWLALFTVSTRTARRTASVGLALTLLPVLANAAQELRLAAPADRAATMLVSTIAGVLVTLGVFGVGRWVRWSVEQRRLVAELAAAEAAADERARMARDLHDVVAHAVSVMMLQAAGARAMIGVDPERADQALENVDDLGKEAINELRQMLRLLGDATSASTGESRLRGVDALVLTARSVGRPAQLRSSGRPEPLDRPTDEAAFRIVQEAVTNSLKHAPPAAPLTVRVDWLPGRVRINVVDGTGGPVSQSAALGTGRGLRGMRERAGAVGGTLITQALAGGGFAVVAELPTIREKALA